MSTARFAVISDLHYFSPELTDGGRAYELRSGSDQKMLLESGGIIRSVFSKLAQDDSIDSVLISGDITDDGEMSSHFEIKEMLSELSKHKKVYITTATHDWCCDKNARVYFGDREKRTDDTADIQKLRELYDEFGVNNAISVYETELGEVSYVAKLCDGFRIFGLNDDKNGNDHSGYSKEHSDWIVAQMKEAVTAGDRIIAMQHHVVLKHYTDLLTKGGICCSDRETVAENFATNGTELLFVGHSHLQNITEYTAKNGNRMTQINVGALCGWPAPIVKVNIDGNKTEIHTEFVDKFTFNGREYTSDAIYYHTRGLIENVVNAAASGDLDEFIDRCSALGIHSPVLKRLFFVIRRIAAYIKTVKVGKFAKTVNVLTFGRGINRSSALDIKEKEVFELIIEIFLNLFDGGQHRYQKGSSTYTVVTDFVSLPSRITKKIPFIPESVRLVFDEIPVLVGLLMDDVTDNYSVYYEKQD